MSKGHNHQDLLNPFVKLIDKIDAAKILTLTEPLKTKLFYLFIKTTIQFHFEFIESCDTNF